MRMDKHATGHMARKLLKMAEVLEKGV
jgi:hypothetical protein